MSNLGNTQTNNYITGSTISTGTSYKNYTHLLGKSFTSGDISSNKNPLFSKSLSQVKTHLMFVDYYSHRNTNCNYHRLMTNTFYNTLISKTKSNISINNHNTTNSESYYVDPKGYDFSKTKTTQITLNDIHKMNKTVNYPSHFNFNLKTNLILAQQQRWLAKNSLLTESITHNSFLVTQAKKLIGSGTLDKDSSNKSLWLPTKSSKLSSVESSSYFNNLTRQLFKKNPETSYLYTNNLTHSFFNNLNFFENSRIFLLKKYYFTNNQSYNLFTSNPENLVNSTSGLVTGNVKNFSNLNFQTNLYATNLNLLTHNNLTPSLHSLFIKTKSPQLEELELNKINNQTNISISLAKLDIFSGTQNNFFFNITSNPQKLNTDNTYFNNITSSYALKSTSIDSVKFSK
jgi:YHS domain-containing protein